MENLYNDIIDILKSNGISYKEYKHGPILNYEDALKEKSIHNWNGFESKNVFMTNKKGKYFLFVTIEGQKVDFKYLKEIFQEKLSLASFEEVKNIILCTPGCVAPFGFSKEIVTIVDKNIFNLQGNYLFSPGVADKTIELNILDLKGIFNNIENAIYV